MKPTPTKSEIFDAITAGKYAAAYSKQLRGKLKRRKTTLRSTQLTLAREKCADAAEPLRSYIGMIAWHDIPNDIDIEMKKVMEALRYERRQIDKMLS